MLTSAHRVKAKTYCPTRVPRRGTKTHPVAVHIHGEQKYMEIPPWNITYLNCCSLHRPGANQISRTPSSKCGTTHWMFVTIIAMTTTGPMLRMHYDMVHCHVMWCPPSTWEHQPKIISSSLYYIELCHVMLSIVLERFPLGCPTHSELSVTSNLSYCKLASYPLLPYNFKWNKSHWLQHNPTSLFAFLASSTNFSVSRCLWSIYQNI